MFLIGQLFCLIIYILNIFLENVGFLSLGHIRVIISFILLLLLVYKMNILRNITVKMCDVRRSLGIYKGTEYYEPGKHVLNYTYVCWMVVIVIFYFIYLSYAVKTPDLFLQSTEQIEKSANKAH